MLSQTVECRAAHTVPRQNQVDRRPRPRPHKGHRSRAGEGSYVIDLKRTTDGWQAIALDGLRPTSGKVTVSLEDRSPGGTRALSVDSPSLVRERLTETPGSFEPVRSLTALPYASMVGARIPSPRTMVSHHMCP
ncbi:hypothetical protein GCM10010451_32440 [Streptomyces virens]|uniref:Uncharacterized protein n=1 Tax=Streptomyces virens TaxID=285572 RepID=A0ABP6PKI2_9ACTN